MNGKTIILMLAAAMLLPLHSSAQDKPKVKSVDLTIPVPTPGMTLEEAREFQLKSAKTEFGDLAATGDITVSSLDWDGDFVENDDGDMFFKDGFNYKVRLQFMVNPSGGYTTDYVFKNNDYYIDGTRIKATLNGVEARVLYSAPYFINIELIMKVGAGGANSDRAAAQRAKSDYELNKNSYRGSLKAYSIEKADLMCPDTNPCDVVVVTDSYDPTFYANNSSSDFYGQKCMRVTKLIVDTDKDIIYTLKASDIVNTIQGPYNIREVWLSDKVDIVTFVRTVFNVVRVNGYTPENSDIYYPTYSMLMYSSRATLFIPESAAADVKAIFTRPTWSYHTLFTVKTYSGDVYAAQKAGAGAAKPFCTNHVYNDKVAAADKIYKYSVCGTNNRYYYSCRICGRNEHDPKHIFIDSNEAGASYHSYESPLADEQAYVGVNASGHHVWWYSCIWCGHSQGYDQKHITKSEWLSSGNEASYEQFKQAMREQAEDYESQALLKTTALPGMFILPYKSSAKTSAAFQSCVNFALNDNLLDDAVLGNDYTVPITRLQLKSLAVRLAEELIGHEIAVDKKQRSLFADDYSAKAAAMGLLDGHFSPSSSGAQADNTPATRQEVAAMIYGTLRYIEKQGVYSYTEYDSGLSRYSDCDRIAPWAKEAMAFMDALGLLKGTSETVLAPEAVCTIEKAVEVAEKSTHAQQLGWYQARSWGEGSGREYSGHVHIIPVHGGNINEFISPGERVWVTGPRLGQMWDFLPIVDPYSGQTMYVKAEWFRPVRKYVFTSDRTTFEPLHTRDYIDGVSVFGE